MSTAKINNSTSFVETSLQHGVLCSFHRRTSRTTLVRWACGTTSIMHINLMRELYRSGLLSKAQCRHIIDLMCATPVGRIVGRSVALAENINAILANANRNIGE